MEKEKDDDICLVLFCMTLGCGMAMASEFEVNFYRRTSQVLDSRKNSVDADEILRVYKDSHYGVKRLLLKTHDETFDNETEKSADDSTFTINYETEKSADDSTFTIKRYVLITVGVHYCKLPSSRQIRRNWSDIYIQLISSRQIRRNWSEIYIQVINQQFLAGTISTTVPNRQDKTLQDAKSPTTTTTVSDKKRVSEDDGHEENFKLNNSNQVTVCGFCVDENEASYICYKCKCTICHACKVVHTKVWILMSHELHKISETTGI